jgi:putative transposase
MYPRIHARLGDDYYVGRRRYFVTICTHQRTAYFADAQAAAWMVRQLQRVASGRDFLLHAWCVMPDHVHILVEGREGSCELREFVSALKQCTAQAFASRWQRKLWQRYFYDHVVRTEESMDQIAAYVWHNPVRKGICAQALDYPYSGSLTMGWRKCADPSWTPPWKM